MYFVGLNKCSQKCRTSVLTRNMLQSRGFVAGLKHERIKNFCFSFRAKNKIKIVGIDFVCVQYML